MTDLAFAILWEDDEGLTYLFHHDYKIGREIQFSEWYEPGDYVVVPLSTGGLVSRPENPSNIQDWSKINVIERFKYHDFETTIQDIYRRFDLNMNRRLDEEELNQLGYITENEFLHSITKDDFAKTATKLGRISYVDTEQDADNYGLTPFGFI